MSNDAKNRVDAVIVEAVISNRFRQGCEKSKGAFLERIIMTIAFADVTGGN